MSPRAAWRLERFGFDVYDYVAGKADWAGAGLPTERSADLPPRAIDAAERDVPTCGPDARVGEARAIADAAGWASVVVVNDKGVVQGRLRRRELEGDAGARADDVMQPGPSTVRAHQDLEELFERMRKAQAHEVVVTTPGGELLGVVRDAVVREGGVRES